MMRVTLVSLGVKSSDSHTVIETAINDVLKVMEKSRAVNDYYKIFDFEVINRGENLLLVLKYRFEEI